MAGLSVGGETRLNVVSVPANASSLSLMVMVCKVSTLLSSAPCIAELIFDLLHVTEPLIISVMVRSAPKFGNSLLTFACTILLIPKVICNSLK